MHENIIDIPNYKRLKLSNIVLDYNGTIAKDGILKEELKTLLPKLTQMYQVHVITADTFGSVKKELQDFDVKIKILESQNHTEEKADFIGVLNSNLSVAIGNGNNDALMLEKAEIGIALLGDEGCSLSTLQKSDIVCKNIGDAIGLFLNTKRLIATLRK
jgi:P-type E1-E2 ATPase